MTTKYETKPLQEPFPEFPAELCGGQSLLFDYMELPPLSTIIPGSSIACERDGHLDVLPQELFTELSRPLWTDSALFTSASIHSPLLSVSHIQGSPIPTNLTEASYGAGERGQSQPRDAISYEDFLVSFHPNNCCIEGGADPDAPRSKQHCQQHQQRRQQIPAWNPGRSSSFASTSGTSSCFGSPSFSSISIPLSSSVEVPTPTTATMRTASTSMMYPNGWQEASGSGYQGWLSSSYSPSVSPLLPTTPLSLPDSQLHGSPLLTYPSLRRNGDERFTPLPIAACLPHARRSGCSRGKARSFEETSTTTTTTTKAARRRAASSSSAGPTILHFCSECPRSFARARDLKRHFRLHSGERPYLCTACGESFIRSDARGRHFANNPSCGAVAAILATQQ